MKNNLAKTVGLYVHIPFCATKCPYCDFYSVNYSSALEEDYINAIVAEMQTYKEEGYIADTLYFGGGTPSLVSTRNIARIIKTARQVFSLEGEITIEANPNSVNLGKLSEYFSMGINRISFGMQSAEQTELAALGRTHTTAQTFLAVANAVTAGISNISLDLMIGTPFQSEESLLRTISSIADLPITHLSAYMLQIEEGTPFFCGEIRNKCADENLSSSLYLSAVEKLSAIGLSQYEISSFAKNGAKSVHNLKYWQLAPYIGFGASAHSFLNGLRFFHQNDISMYIIEKGAHTIVTDESCGGVDEYIMLGLRLTDGIRLCHLQDKYGVDTIKLARSLKRHSDQGYIEMKNGKLFLTQKGFLLSNTIITDVISAILP